MILLWDLTHNLTQLWLLIAAVQKGKLPHPSSSCVWKQRLPVTEHQIQIRHSAMSQDGTVSIRFLSSIASTSHTSPQGEIRLWNEENMVVQVALANLHTVIFVFAFSRFPWLMKDMGCIPNSTIPNSIEASCPGISGWQPLTLKQYEFRKQAWGFYILLLLPETNLM